jgi:hypothetical protein
MEGFLAPSYVERLKEERIWTPRSRLGKFVKDRVIADLPADVQRELIELISAVTVVESSLSARVYRNYGLYQKGLIPWAAVEVEDHGQVGIHVVTNTGVGFIVDAFQNLVEVENMKYHGLGTGSTAEAAGDSALVTELTTEYTGNVRATGTTTENAANIYETVATNTLDSGNPVLREHGVFSASSVGVLLDRTVFAAITLDGTVGDALQTTYRLTFTAGS